MTDSPEPPPITPGAKQRKPRLRFNTATLLGVMSLVAVACFVVVAIPWLLAVVATLVASAALVAYAAFLIAGAVVAKGNKRLFAIASIACLVVSCWTQATGNITMYFLDRGGMSGTAAGMLWAFIAPIEHVALSLFGGWVALRAAKFWHSDES